MPCKLESACAFFEGVFCCYFLSTLEDKSLHFNCTWVEVLECNGWESGIKLVNFNHLCCNLSSNEMVRNCHFFGSFLQNDGRFETPSQQLFPWLSCQKKLEISQRLNDQIVEKLNENEMGLY